MSELYISEDTHLLSRMILSTPEPKHLLTFLVVSVTLTASRHCLASTDTLPVHLKLLALDLDYVWQTNSNATASGRLDAAINPFARHLSLPYLTVTDNAVGRFVSYHLVRCVSFSFLFFSGKIYHIGRRYPLIFGPWCKQLDVERSLFPSILSSIQNIIMRSRSPVFQATCQKMFKVCLNVLFSCPLEQHSAALQARDNVYFCFCRWGIVKLSWLRSGNILGSRNLRIQ